MRSEVQVLPSPLRFFPLLLSLGKASGAIAQLVAHLLCKQRVAGSNPASSTSQTLGITMISRVFPFLVPMSVSAHFNPVFHPLGRIGTRMPLAFESRISARRENHDPPDTRLLSSFLVKRRRLESKDRCGRRILRAASSGSAAGKGGTE